MTTERQILHRIENRDDGEVHHVTVNNPSKLNVLNSAIMDTLCDTLDDIGTRDAARVVVLRGAGERAWIGGADIYEMAAIDGETAAVTFIRRVHRVCHSVRQHPVPVIAAIQGYCLGAGLEVAACCDLRLAATTARFGMPEVRVGLASVVEAAVLPRLIGIGHARDLVMTARTVEPAEAQGWGFLNGVTEPAGLESLVETRVGEILAGAPGAMRAQKELCRAWEEQPLTQAIESGVIAFGESFRTPEPREYLQRFVNRRRTDQGTSD